MGIDLSLARSFNGQEDHVFEFVDHCRLNSVRLRRGHASKRLQRQHHVAELMDGVIDVFANFQMPFATASELVVERMRQICQFGLGYEVVSNSAQMLDRPVIEE